MIQSNIHKPIPLYPYVTLDKAFIKTNKQHNYKFVIYKNQLFK